MLALVLLALGGELELPAFFSDRMVLQRETRAPVWGWARPHEPIEVTASWKTSQRYMITADERGWWSTEITTPAAGGPYTLTVASPGGTRVLSDVLVGEVWLASGQSNMEWTLGPHVGAGVEGWEEATLAAEDPLLRVFDVRNALAAEPTVDVGGCWMSADRSSSVAFSATAYFFARALRAELDVPVGVITADWGGTPAEAWMRPQALGAFPEFAEGLARVQAVARDPAGARRARAEALAAWFARLEELDPVDGTLASEPLVSDELPWSSVQVPGTFEGEGAADFDGVGWYKRTVTLPAGWSGKELVLELGAIDDRDSTFWNGARLGGHEGDGAWETPRRYAIPADRVESVNGLAVRVVDTGGTGGFIGPAERVRIFPDGDEGQALALAGAWLGRRSVPLAELGWPPALDVLVPDEPGVLWNGMLAPLVPFALRGVIWYQGESNRERADQYAALFPALVDDWRTAFARLTMPFYFVQIAPFAYPGDTGEAARLRDAQRRALELPGTGMAVTMDIGDPDDIHPVKKREVGERLALLALRRTYMLARECSGPLYRAATAEGATLRIDFDHAAGLTSHGEPVRHVTVAGDDRVFHPAQARIEGESLRVSSPAVARPVAVRFGWGAADQTNLWNAAGLPAACFRTDDWP